MTTIGAQPGPGRTARPAVRATRLVDAAGLALIGVVAFAVRFVGGGGLGGLRGDHGYDEGVYVAAAFALVHGRVPYADYLLLHPPAAILALTPFAALAHWTGDLDALVAARLTWMTIGATNAVLVARLARAWGRPAWLTAGLLYALLPLATVAESSAMLEPVGTLGLLIAVGLLRRGLRDGTSGCWLLAGGLVLGTVPTVKIWGVVPAVVVLGWVGLASSVPGRPAARPADAAGTAAEHADAARAAAGSAAAGRTDAGRAAAGRRPASRAVVWCTAAWRTVAWRPLLRVTAAAGVGLAVVVVPFAVAAGPGRMWRQVISDQVGRTDADAWTLARWEHVLGVELGPVGGTADRRITVLVVVATVLAAALVLAWRSGRGRLWVVLLLAQLGVLLSAPVFFRHYTAYLAAAFCLVVGAAMASFRRPRVSAAVAVGAVAVLVGLLGVGGLKLARPFAFPARQVTAVLPDEPCTRTDSPIMLVLLGRLSRQLDAGCPLPVDLSGITFDDGYRDATGSEVVRPDDPRYQRYVVDYLTGSRAIVLARTDGDGFTPATEAALREGRRAVHLPGVVVLVPRS